MPLNFNPLALDMFTLDPRTRDLAAEVLDGQGRLRVLPAAYWASTTRDERALLGHRHGVYSFPTVELIDRLRTLIDGRSAIEIGAGQGVLAEALGIPATDNRMQEDPECRANLARIGQAPVTYGPNVEACHASRAVRRYAPQVVVGAWVMHKYDPARHYAGGNEVGVDEADILRNCETYIAIGNEHVHRFKPIWPRVHAIEYPRYVYSRAHSASREFIAVWPGLRRRPGGL